MTRSDRRVAGSRKTAKAPAARRTVAGVPPHVTPMADIPPFPAASMSKRVSPISKASFAFTPSSFPSAASRISGSGFDSAASSAVVCPEIRSAISRRSHWDGVHWLDVALPRSSDGYTFLAGLTTILSSDIWAVGTSGGSPINPLIAHRNGSAWRYVPNPPVPSDYAFLKA
jgi:hypothetical protein